MVQTAYKLFRLKDNRIYPLFVKYPNEIKVGVWLEAKEGERYADGKVKSKLGHLCYRPGWHLCNLPYVQHIGKRNEKGQIEYLPKEYVWCEVSFNSGKSYQDEANRNGLNKQGKLISKLAYLKYIPKGGYYRYKTSPIMFGEWFITGEMRINKVLSDNEVKSICAKNGITAQLREP